LITIGQDHIQNNDQTTATFVGLIAEDLANGSGTDIFLSEVGANPKESFGVGICKQSQALVECQHFTFQATC
jgi:hypothetical protein